MNSYKKIYTGWMGVPLLPVLQTISNVVDTDDDNMEEENEEEQEGAGRFPVDKQTK